MVGKKNQLKVERLSYTVEDAIRMLDNVVDTYKLPVKKVEETAKYTRRCGLGVLG